MATGFRVFSFRFRVSGVSVRAVYTDAGSIVCVYICAMYTDAGTVVCVCVCTMYIGVGRPRDKQV